MRISTLKPKLASQALKDGLLTDNPFSLKAPGRAAYVTRPGRMKKEYIFMYISDKNDSCSYFINK